MIEKLDDMFQFHRNALNLRTFRQQVLASNIANADTPGYKARDIDFAVALKDIAAGREANLSLRTSDARHMSPDSNGGDPAKLLYRDPVQPSIDGNTVDMNMERNRFAENAVHIDANLTFLNAKIKTLLAALQG
jgi:flagellar basal-body rod protein FlgB